MARPRKLKDQDLVEILEKYMSETPYITTLKYTDLARFANENGYENVTHQDFCRNKLVKNFVSEFKKQNKLTTYSNLKLDKINKLTFNVEDIVEKYDRDKKQLINIFKVFQSNYYRAFDKMEELSKELSSAKEKLKEQEKSIKLLKEQKLKLRKEMDDIEDKYRTYKKEDKNRYIHATIKDLIAESNITIKSEEDIIDLLKNFGIKGEDLVDEDSTLKKLSSTKVDYGKINKSSKEEKNISFKDIKTKLDIPDFLK
ncbi:hypothetical protein [Clostridium sp. UBA1652]|uniref:hypothetical protein n=1 Tax=Clostridium sp. UBA1652 TaxID=1946348 RepID=UPI00257F6747|nr:hypothetical protein [Clostridium sp. UBA1652]